MEFVSANPTGPLHIGSARNAAIGDTLANVLAAAGYDVEREYYLNDTGTQIRHFAETLYARYAQALGRDEPMPKDGYPGAYMVPIAQEIVAQHGDRFLDMPREEAVSALGDLGVRSVIAGWTRIAAPSESTLTTGSRSAASTRAASSTGCWPCCKERGLVTEYDGAVWFASKELGQDKDNVIVRSTGDGPTYFASRHRLHVEQAGGPRLRPGDLRVGGRPSGRRAAPEGRGSRCWGWIRSG